MEKFHLEEVSCLSIVKPSPYTDCEPLSVSCNSSDYSSFLQSSSSVLMHGQNRSNLPSYKYLPAMTNLNSFPIQKEFYPKPSKEPRSNMNGFFSTKCELFAITGLAGYGDEVDVIAPAKVLKEIFKAPYSKSGFSVTVHRVGKTLVLEERNDVEVFNVRGKRGNTGQLGKKLFTKFVQNSILESPAEEQDEDEIRKTCPHVVFGTQTGVISEAPASHGKEQQLLEPVSSSNLEENGGFSSEGMSNDKFNSGENPLETFKNFSTRDNATVDDESEESRNDFPRKKNSEPPLEGFLRILFWRLEHVKMLLGSDILLFSNKKHASVSLHLISVSQESNPMKWLDIWLDNVLASVPEAAVCYHLNGVVKGYELIKTDEIPFFKSLASDGSSFFHPQVVQKNASSVLQFLLKSCLKDPGKYILHRNPGEDKLQLFDLTPLSSRERERTQCQVFSEEERKKNEKNGLSLPILLYRLANRLSEANDEQSCQKSAKFYAQCLDYLEETSHPGVKANAHEQVARLLLGCFGELSEVGKEKLLEAATNSLTQGKLLEFKKNTISESLETNKSYEVHSNLTLTYSGEREEISSALEEKDSFSCNSVDIPKENSTDFVSGVELNLEGQNCDVKAKLQAVHHISQAIRSMRVQRSLLENGEDFLVEEGFILRNNSTENGLCVCGEAECLPVREIREGKRLGDKKLFGLIEMLGEAYLSLAVDFNNCGQFGKALRASELACLIYGAYRGPQEADLNGSKFAEISDNAEEKALSFWGRLWCLLGDIYVEFDRLTESVESKLQKEILEGEGVLLTSDVVKEVKRMKKKQGRNKESCVACKEINCSCLNDRCTSGHSASSSYSGESFVKRRTEKKGKERTSFLTDTDPGQKLGEERRIERFKDRSSTKKTKKKSVEHGKENVNRVGSEVKNQLDKGNSERKDMENLRGFNQGNRELEGEDSRTFPQPLLCFGKPLTFDWETNLKAAAEHYSAAVSSFQELYSLNPSAFSKGKMQEAIRKQGWSFNEIGRRLLAAGSLNQAEDWLLKALDSFTQVEDFVNIVLICCNLGHGKRSAAEKCASQIPPIPTIFSDSDLGLEKSGAGKASNFEPMGSTHFENENSLKVMFSLAGKLYSESLSYYNSARREVAKIETEKKHGGGLWNEVHTQFAHTYLRIAMLDSVKAVFRSLVWSELKTSQEIDSIANENFIRALALYESLGNERKKEAAFAHYQMASHQRNNAMLILKRTTAGEINTSNEVQQKLKRCISLAEIHWEKALEVYLPDSHPDVFIQILLDQSDLTLASTSPRNKAMKTSLMILLEGRRIKNINEVSEKEVRKLIGRIQLTLRELLRFLMARGPPSDSSKMASEILKEMYKLSLSSTSTLQELYAKLALIK